MDPIIIDARGGLFSIEAAERAIDAAVADGHRREDLRWRVHPTQRRCIRKYLREVVDHAVEYVREKVHTNGCENFWSLTKRMLNGTYVSVEPFHLAVRGIVGKRIMYDQLTGKMEATA